MQTRKAAEATIERCISRGILVDYLQGRKREVEDITIQLFDEEEVLHVYLLEKEREAAARGEKLALSEASSRARTRLLFVCFGE